VTANTSRASPAGAVDPSCADAVRTQVARILSSDDFSVPERLKAFFCYVVEETLAGREERIKAYSVAVEVFGRDTSFDSQSDPVVRVEAGRLRRTLERYYLTSGRNDPVRIEIPKGRYVPVFTFLEDVSVDEVPPAAEAPPDVEAPVEQAVVPPATSVPRRLRLVGAIAVVVVAVAAAGAILQGALSFGPAAEERLTPSVLVTSLKAVGDDGAADYAASLSGEIDHQLELFREVVALRDRVAGASGQMPPDYVIEGSVRAGETMLRVTVSLVETATGAVAWSQSFDAGRGPGGDGLIRSQVEMAKSIASAIAQPYGAIFQSEAKAIGSLAEASPGALHGRRCLVAFYMYRVSLSAADHLRVRDCIDRVVDAAPRSSTARAMRSLLATDEDRFAYNRQDGAAPALDRALADAREAVRLDPRNLRALQALMVALSFSREPGEALAVAESAYALNPNDAEFLSEYGTRIAHGGDWRRGGEIIETAMRMNPAGAPYYAGVLAFAAYMERDIPRALFWLRQAQVEPSPIFQFVAALIYTDAGLPTEAARARDLSLAAAPVLFENLPDEAAKRNFRSEDLKMLVDGAKRAGFPVPLEHAGSDLAGEEPPSPN
jgi:adenylate cyclase